jgi:transcriptional regulator with AAA-type ATPase domain
VRRSGPGGQHRNKVETGIVLRHEPTGIQAEANERRIQAENLAVAWQRLRVRLALEVRRPWESREASELWRSRIVGRGIAINEEHSDYPALLAEALDVLAASDWDDAQAAANLGISRSQFTRFLRREPTAFARLNSERAARGKHRLM